MARRLAVVALVFVVVGAGWVAGAKEKPADKDPQSLGVRQGEGLGGGGYGAMGGMGMGMGMGGTGGGYGMGGGYGVQSTMPTVAKTELRIAQTDQVEEAENAIRHVFNGVQISVGTFGNHIFIRIDSLYADQLDQMLRGMAKSTVADFEYVDDTSPKPRSVKEGEVLGPAFADPN